MSDGILPHGEGLYIAALEIPRALNETNEELIRFGFDDADCDITFACV